MKYARVLTGAAFLSALAPGRQDGEKEDREYSTLPLSWPANKKNLEFISRALRTLDGESPPRGSQCVRVREQRFKEERLYRRSGILLECLMTRKSLRAIHTTKMIHNKR